MQAKDTKAETPTETETRERELTLADLKGYQAGELEYGTVIEVTYTSAKPRSDRRITIRGEVKGIEWDTYEGSDGMREECVISVRKVRDYTRYTVTVSEFGTSVRTDYPDESKNQTLGGDVTVVAPEKGQVEAETATPEGSTIRLRGEYRNCRWFDVVEVVDESGAATKITESVTMEAGKVYNHMVVPFTDDEGDELHNEVSG